jgi:hypothetical protein
MGCCALIWCGSGYGSVGSSCEHGNEPLGSIKCWEVLRVAAQFAASREGLSSVSERGNDYGPITVATRSKAWTVFARSNTEIVGSNPTWGMDVCVCVCSVYVQPCVQVAALRQADLPSKESYRLCKKSRNWKSGQGSTKGFGAKTDRDYGVIVNKRPEFRYKLLAKNGLSHKQAPETEVYVRILLHAGYQ